MTLIFPYSVLLLLKSQKINVKIIKFDKFCWFDVIRIALIYSTEKFASLLLLPALLYKTIFSLRLLYFNEINVSSVDWNKSLSIKRHKVKLSDLIFLINKLR